MRKWANRPVISGRPGGMRGVPGILNLPRIRLHTFRHALLPQRGAADSIEDPYGGSTAAPLFILGLLVDGLRANEVPS